MLKYMFEEVGIIRKGSPKTSKGHMGRDLEHFRVEFKESYEALGKKFEAVYGKEPTDITVMSPFDHPADIWESWLEAHGGSGAKVMMVDPDTYEIQYQIKPGVGEVVIRNGADVSTGEIVKWDGSSPAYTYRNKQGQMVAVKPTLRCRLRMVVPALEEMVFLTLKSGSWNDRRNLMGQLWGYWQANNQSLKGLLFHLRRRPQEVITSRPDGKRIRETKSLVALVPDRAWASAAIQRMIINAMPEGADMSLLQERYSFMRPSAEETIAQAEPETEITEDEAKTLFEGRIAELDLGDQVRQEFLDNAGSFVEALQLLEAAFPLGPADEDDAAN